MQDSNNGSKKEEYFTVTDDIEEILIKT